MGRAAKGRGRADGYKKPWQRSILDGVRSGDARGGCRYPLFMLVVGLAYTIPATLGATNSFAARQSLDGDAWLRQSDGLPEDYAAIQWLRRRVHDNPQMWGRIVEMPGPKSGDFTRVSTLTGLPTIVGLVTHELQWRAGNPEIAQDLQKRVDDEKRILTTTDNTEAQNLLTAYGIRYVFVGTLETGARTATPSHKAVMVDLNAPALTKFRAFMTPIYSAQGVTIYEWHPSTALTTQK